MNAEEMLDAIWNAFDWCVENNAGNYHRHDALEQWDTMIHDPGNEDLLACITETNYEPPSE